MNNTTGLFPLIIQASEGAKGLGITASALLFVLILLLNIICVFIVLVFNAPKLFTKKMISSSLKIALKGKLRTFGFIRMLFVTSIISGIVISLVCFSLADDIMQYGNSFRNSSVALVCGILSGVLTAGGIVYIIRKITRSVKNTVAKHAGKIRKRIKRH